MFDTISLNALPSDITSAALHSVRDPFNIIDRNLRIIWANEGRAEYHQQNLNEMIGNFCYEIFMRRSAPCFECPARIAFESGMLKVMEKRNDLPDGSRKWGEVRAYPVFDKRGKVVYVSQILIDITDKKLNMEKHNRYVESLEKTVNEITKTNVQDLLEYENKKMESNLTKREIEVLILITKGFSNIEIAQILAKSPNTVKTHVVHLFEKLGVRDRTQAAVWAVQHKII